MTPPTEMSRIVKFTETETVDARRKGRRDELEVVFQWKVSVWEDEKVNEMDIQQCECTLRQLTVKLLNNG